MIHALALTLSLSVSVGDQRLTEIPIPDATTVTTGGKSCAQSCIDLAKKVARDWLGRPDENFDRVLTNCLVAECGLKP